MNNFFEIKYLSENATQIPQTGGVYEVLRNDGTPGMLTNVYVGKADNLNVRYSQHLAQSEENQCLKRNLANNECYFRYFLVPSENDRTTLENKLLQDFKWECNIQQQ